MERLDAATRLLKAEPEADNAASRVGLRGAATAAADEGITVGRGSPLFLHIQPSLSVPKLGGFEAGETWVHGGAPANIPRSEHVMLSPIFDSRSGAGCVYQ